MSFSKVVNGILALAETVAPLLEGTPVGAAVNVGKAVIGMIDDVKDIASSDEAAALAERRAVLEPLVLAHLDETIESLS